MGDYISRQAAIEAIKGWDWLELYLPIHFQRTLEKISPADVRPVARGNWIPVTNGRGGHECSKCHQYAPSYQSGSEYLSRFCPACGCYMGECEE